MRADRPRPQRPQRSLGRGGYMSNEQKSDDDEVRTVVESYFTAIHEGDIDRLKEVFEPTATLIGWDEGELRRVNLDQWFEFVKSIPSPASEGVIQDGKIVWLDVTGTAAVAKVTETYRMFKYVDYLTLLKIGDQWRVVGKCYHQYER